MWYLPTEPTIKRRVQQCDTYQQHLRWRKGCSNVIPTNNTHDEEKGQQTDDREEGGSVLHGHWVVQVCSYLVPHFVRRLVFETHAATPTQQRPEILRLVFVEKVVPHHCVKNITWQMAGVVRKIHCRQVEFSCDVYGCNCSVFPWVKLFSYIVVFWVSICFIPPTFRLRCKRRVILWRFRVLKLRRRNNICK